jgi:hypothetical protein
MPLFTNLRAETSHTTALQHLFDKPTLSSTYSIIPAPSPHLTLAAPAVLGSRAPEEAPKVGRVGGRRLYLHLPLPRACALFSFIPPLRTPADLYYFLTASRPSMPPHPRSAGLALAHEAAHMVRITG